MQVVFDPFGVAAGSVLVDSYDLEKLRQNTVSVVDVLCDGYA